MGNNFCKNCPNCNSEMCYTMEKSLISSVKKNTLCRICASIKNRGKISETLKRKYESKELIPNMAGAHSLESRKKQSETKTGSKLTEEHKNKIKNSIKNSKVHKESVKCVKRNKKISDSHKNKEKSKNHRLNLSKNHADVSGNKNPFYGKKHSVETKKIIRKKAINRITHSKNNNFQLVPFYNPKGCEYLNEIMEKTNSFIQHAENGGEFYIKELGYWVDGYDKENNIVYEYDEKHHFNLDGSYIEKDIIRENEITDFLKCTFIRIKE